MNNVKLFFFLNKYLPSTYKQLHDIYLSMMSKITASLHDKIGVYILSYVILPHFR
jgi:hypothetical protein